MSTTASGTHDGPATQRRSRQRGVTHAARAWSCVLLAAATAGGQVPAPTPAPTPTPAPPQSPPPPATGTPAAAEPASAPATDAPGAKPSAPAAPTTLDQLPPPVRLGARAELLKQNAPVAPVVVIVKDPTSYLAAIGAWKPVVRFPVLIDDGTPDSHEDIARFVRAFRVRNRDAKLVRFAAPGAGGNWREVTEFQLRSAHADSFGVKPGPAIPRQQQVSEALKQLPTPGIVVTHPSDLAWPAAIALAAGRAQALHFVKVKGDLAGILETPEADALATSIEGAAALVGVPWNAEGDAIDAVTLCLNCPVKVRTPEQDEVALTDRIGRLSAGGAPAKRWAWAGQIFGSPARSSYMAMCGLFLSPRKAWIFDGYPDTKPWNLWDGTKAAEVLKESGWEVVLDDTPRQGLRDWRGRASRPSEVGLVLINSKGNSDFFELEIGQGRPADLPILDIPAMVHIVHSWSAQWPARRETVAGRWLERGAYAYAGSVKEPFLHAFQPTPTIATRFCLVAPWGAAVRLDDAPMWKVAVFGDPLITVGERFKMVAAEVVLDPEKGALKGAVEAGGGLADLAREGKYLEVVRELALLGKDDKVRDLVLALLNQKPEQITSELAAASILPLLRSGVGREVFQVAARLSPATRKDPFVAGQVRDGLWLAAYPLLDRPEEEMLRVLRANLRPEMAERDTAEFGQAWARRFSKAEAFSVLDGLKDAAGEIGLPAEAVEKAITAVKAMRNVK